MLSVTAGNGISRRFASSLSGLAPSVDGRKATPPMLIIGGDFGQSDTNVALRRTGPRGGKQGVQLFTFPSLIATGDGDRVRRMREATGGASQQQDDMVLTYAGGTFFVGALAHDGQRPTTARGDADRYTQGHTLRLLLATVGKLIDDGHAKNHATIRLVTGLPIEFWSPERKLQVQRSLLGTHHFGYNGRDLACTVDAVAVPMEGAAALAASAAQPVDQAVVDIGWGTIDLFWAKGSIPTSARCRGDKVGVGRVADLLRTGVQALPDGRLLTDAEVRTILRAVAQGLPLPVLTSRGKPLPIESLVHASLATVGRDIASFVRQVWGDDDGRVAAAASVVRCIGGGAYLWGDLLKADIPQLDVPDCPEYANALSYLASGEAATEAQWARNRGGQ